MHGEPLPNETQVELPDPVAEELTAYLDGELDAPSRSAVEARLANDAAYRARLQSLQNAWDLLDQLPRTQPNDAFTRSTLEMVAQSAALDLTAANPKIPSPQGWFRIAGVVLVALALGYGLTFASLQKPNRQLLLDLPTIDRIDILRHIESLEFLRQLEQSGLFAAEETASSQTQTSAGEASPLASPDYSRLSPARREELREKQVRFDALEPEAKNQARRVNHDLALAADGETLLAVAERYADWLKTLGPGERGKVLDAPAGERLEKIRASLKEQQVRQFNNLATKKLLPADLEAILAWIDEVVAGREKELFANLPPELQRRIENTPNPVQRRLMIVVATNRVSPGKMFALAMAGGIQQLAARLSPETQRELASAADERERLAILRAWVQAAVASRILPQIDTQKLRAFYASGLSPEQRERLDSLPREQMEQELRNLFVQQESRRWEKHLPLGPPPKPPGGFLPPALRPRPKSGDESHRLDLRNPGEFGPDRPGPGGEPRPPPK